VHSIPWLLTAAALVLWIQTVLRHLRTPPALPSGWSVLARRALWGGLAICALLAGGWGPALWSQSTLQFPRDPEAGLPAHTAQETLRTPFAVQMDQRTLDGEGRWIQGERTLVLQLPWVLLLFLGVSLWLRRREESSPPLESGGGSRSGSQPL